MATILMVAVLLTGAGDRGGHAEAVYTPLPHKRELLCLHSHEGAWNARGYYEGGLQMDHDFSTTYGADMWRKYGTGPHAWTPRDQMVVAERAYKVRGWGPWPTTRRMCGI